jgi:hypothetical protein
MPTLDYLRNEIEHMRRQVARQRSEIRQLQRAGISTSSAEELLARMQTKIDGLCAERDRQVGEQRRKYPGAQTRSSTVQPSGASGNAKAALNLVGLLES